MISRLTHAQISGVAGTLHKIDIFCCFWITYMLLRKQKRLALTQGRNIMIRLCCTKDCTVSVYMVITKTMTFAFETDHQITSKWIELWRQSFKCIDGTLLEFVVYINNFTQIVLYLVLIVNGVQFSKPRSHKVSKYHRVYKTEHYL